MDRRAWQASWGCKELDMTEQLSLSHTHTYTFNSKRIASDTDLKD